MVFTILLEVVNTGNLGTAYALIQTPSLDRSSKREPVSTHSAGSIFLGSTSGSFPCLAEPSAVGDLCIIKGMLTRAGCHRRLPRRAMSTEDGQHLPKVCHQEKDREGCWEPASKTSKARVEQVSPLCPAENVREPSGRGLCPGAPLSRLQSRWGWL